MKQRSHDQEFRFVDTTIRDGHLSLWASSMTTAMILPIAGRLDRAGYEAIEIISGAQIKKFIRELKDDPFERLRLTAALTPNTPLRATGSRINTFGLDPKCMYRLFLELLVASGVRQIRLSDPWNSYEGQKRRVRDALNAGLQPVVNLIYSVSPRHTDDYYLERIRLFSTLPAYRICLKDPGGLLTPERTRTLARLVLENSNGIPVEFHTHCNTGLGPLCALEAIQAGIKTINAAIPPLADGASNPSVFNVAANARALGYKPLIDEEVLRPVSRHFTFVAEAEGLPIGAPVPYDYSQYLHQIPGGMISNMAHQLRLVGLADRLPEALEETARVRAELAYPIMVTPLSQFVGSQAAINVVVGERYKEITDPIINYALGRYGQEGADQMDPDVKDRILSTPRAKELANWERPDPSLAEMRASYGGAGVSDEEVMLRWITSEAEVTAVKAAGPPAEYRSDMHPLVARLGRLLRQADADKNVGRIDIRRPGYSLTLER